MLRKLQNVVAKHKRNSKSQDVSSSALSTDSDDDDASMVPSVQATTLPTRKALDGTAAGRSSRPATPGQSPHTDTVGSDQVDSMNKNSAAGVLPAGPGEWWRQHTREPAPFAGARSDSYGAHVRSVKVASHQHRDSVMRSRSAYPERLSVSSYGGYDGDSLTGRLLRGSVSGRTSPRSSLTAASTGGCFEVPFLPLPASSEDALACSAASQPSGTRRPQVVDGGTRAGDLSRAPTGLTSVQGSSDRGTPWGWATDAAVPSTSGGQDPVSGRASGLSNAGGRTSVVSNTDGSQGGSAWGVDPGPAFVSHSAPRAATQCTGASRAPAVINRTSTAAGSESGASTIASQNVTWSVTGNTLAAPGAGIPARHISRTSVLRCNGFTHLGTAVTSEGHDQVPEAAGWRTHNRHIQGTGWEASAVAAEAQVATVRQSEQHTGQRCSDTGGVALAMQSALYGVNHPQ